MTDIQSISDIELIRESEELECKLALGRDGKGALPVDFWETYSAMANTDGGLVLLGVQEKKGRFEIRGICEPDRIRKELIDLANNPKKVSVNLLTNDSIKEWLVDGKTLMSIWIPRAARKQRPVYLQGNPLGGNAYRRMHESDQKIGDEEVKRMLADQTQDSLDDRILPHHDLEDLHAESLATYRQMHATLNPGHPWTGLSDREFLKSIGAWRRNRETGESGLTVAGLLMFGTHPVIQEVFPYYMLDYQERPEPKAERRWIDRVTLDGTWSGNVFDFYRRVYPKLIASIKVPFELRDGVRQEDTPVHIALREALANVIVHADYRQPASVLVVKRPDMFGFRNPGLMRVPPDVALRGDEHDCRNRLLHGMFRYVNVGEQAGTGIPKILSGWRSQHWRVPSLREESEPNPRTLLELQMLDLFPPGVIDVLKLHFGDEFERLPELSRLALATTFTEGRLTHARLAGLCEAHAADVSKTLRDLVKDGFLTTAGLGRGAVYRFVGTAEVTPDDVFGSGARFSLAAPPQSLSSRNLPERSRNLEQSSRNLEESSRNLEESRDSMGRLLSPHHKLPFVDNVDALSLEFRGQLEGTAFEPRKKKKIQGEIMKSVILRLCSEQFVTVRSLALLLDRLPETLQRQYLSPMCRTRELEMAFPDAPNDSRQAYTTQKP
jgi:predicted HTH transcriptional regulator